MPNTPDAAQQASAWRRTRRMAGRIAVALVALAAGGAALECGTAGVRKAETEAGLLREPPAIDRSDALSQQLAIFTLGGLRSLAAGLLALDATGAWLENDWQRAERRWEMVTNLAPHRINYWTQAARYMAVDAESYARGNTKYDRVESAKLARMYYDRGVRFLEDGIANNPDSALLHCELGDVLSDLYRRHDFSKAAVAYRRAIALGAPARYERMEFYNLCRVRGREKEAYALGRKLFQNKKHHVPSVLNLLFALQNRMGLPERERLTPEAIYGSEEEALDNLEAYLHNALFFPVDGVEAYLRAHGRGE